MFEPKTFWEKRVALNESYTDQLFQVVFSMTAGDQQKNQRLQQIYSRYQQQQQYLKDVHAFNTLPKSELAMEDIANWEFIENMLRQNLGRTFFMPPAQAMVQKFDERGATHDGAIGTASFRVKYKDWLAELDDIDAKIGPDIEANFYADRSYREAVFPQIILPIDGEILAVAFVGRLSTQSLALSYMPAEWDWEKHRGSARSEFFSYRGNVSKVQFIRAFADALGKQGQSTIYIGALLTDTQLEELKAAGVSLAIDTSVQAPTTAVETAPDLPPSDGVEVPTQPAANDADGATVTEGDQTPE